MLMFKKAINWFASLRFSVFSGSLVLVFLLSLILFNACKKDALLTTPLKSTQTFKVFDWSPAERKFFSLRPSTTQTAETRNVFDEDILYHPLVIDAYNKLAEDNEIFSFAEGIVNKSGLPIWVNSFVYKNSTTNENLVLVPLVYENKTYVNGFISLQKNPSIPGSDFLINGMSLQNILDTTSGNAWQKAVYAELMIKYDHHFFGEVDPKLKDAYCFYKSKIDGLPPITNGDPIDNPPAPPAPGNCNGPNGDCNWRTVEVCWDNAEQIHWYGGIHNIPPHLDHDNDGIINYLDQDFIDLGITQSDYEDRVEDWWAENFEEEYGGYDEFWDDGNYSPDGGTGIDINFDGLEDIWNDLVDFIDEQIREDQQDDLYDEGDEIRCPYPDDPLTGVADDRTIECGWFYLLDCGTGLGPDISWYDDFAAVVPCPDCPGYLEYEDQLRDRLFEHWQKNIEGPIEEYFSLYNLVLDWNCDPYSPCFEECVNENYWTIFFSAPPEGQLPITDVKAALDNCFGTTCNNCTYTVSLFLEQPVPGTTTLFTSDEGTGTGGSKNGNHNPGHAFLELKQTNAMGVSVTKGMGYYPTSDETGLLGTVETEGMFYNETGTTLYNIKVTWQLTEDKFLELRAVLDNVWRMYNVRDNNCTTTVVGALNALDLGIELTRQRRPLVGWIEGNPGSLGEDLRWDSKGGVFESWPIKQHYTPATCQ